MNRKPYTTTIEGRLEGANTRLTSTVALRADLRDFRAVILHRGEELETHIYTDDPGSENGRAEWFDHHTERQTNWRRADLVRLAEEIDRTYHRTATAMAAAALPNPLDDPAFTLRMDLEVTEYTDLD